MKALQHAIQMDSAMTSELNRERASGLGRTGRLIEDAIAECATIKAALEKCPPGPKRQGLLEEYEANRQRAMEQRWYLEVQREAMGLRKHTDLDQFFPMPPRIKE